MKHEDQADNLRKLMRQVRQTRTIAVTSGKGGVGKSNIALNLSVLLSAAGARVALVDADLGLANLDVLLDVSAGYNLAHVVRGDRRLEEVLVDLPCGVQLVPGASGLARMAQLNEFERAGLVEQLTGLEADNDFIVVDCGAGIGPEMLQFASAADNVIVVTTPEPTAITDGYAVLKVLTRRDFEGSLSVLVNFASGRQEARATFSRIADVARQFLGVTVFNAGYVLDDPRVPESVRRREPFVLAYPRCDASRCLAALANKLGPGGALAKRQVGFFRRIANWFGGA